MKYWLFCGKIKVVTSSWDNVTKFEAEFTKLIIAY